MLLTLSEQICTLSNINQRVSWSVQRFLKKQEIAFES